MAATSVIIWWNQTAIAEANGSLTTALLSPNDNGVPALCEFIGHLPKPPKAIRLFYHSPTVEHLATSSPQGNRRTIESALAHRIPALQEPGAMWSGHEPRPAAGGAATLIYIEPTDKLRRLQEALRAKDIHLEAAFPLLSLVEECVPQPDRSVPRIVVMASDNESAVFWVTPAGERHAAFFDGTTAKERIKRELANGFAIFKKPPRFTIVIAGEEAGGLGATIPAETSHTPDRIVSLMELLPAATTLSTKSLCNYLPPGRPFTIDHLCYVAALAFLFAGIFSVSSYATAMRAAQISQAALQTDLSNAQFRINRLKDNERRINEANAVLEEALVSSPTKLRFLEALNRARPLQISIRSANLVDGNWTITAFIHEGAGLEKGPYQAFIGALRKEGGWTIGADHTAPSTNDQEFTLSGTFP